MVEPVEGEPSFVEDDWIGHTLAIGEEVRPHITGPCGRCVMTTLARGALPKDPQILRTAVQHHQGQVGVYAAVVRGGTIRCGDRVRLGDCTGAVRVRRYAGRDPERVRSSSLHYRSALDPGESEELKAIVASTRADIVV